MTLAVIQTSIHIHNQVKHMHDDEDDPFLDLDLDPIILESALASLLLLVPIGQLLHSSTAPGLQSIEKLYQGCGPLGEGGKFENKSFYPQFWQA